MHCLTRHSRENGNLLDSALDLIQGCPVLDTGTRLTFSEVLWVFPMRYAEVAVNAPIGYDRTLSYSIPDRLRLEPGQMVWVPLGSRPVQGVVFHLTDRPQVDVTKDVIAPIEPSPLVTPLGLALARWISSYYMSSLFNAVTLMLPPGFENRVRSYIYPTFRDGNFPPN